MLEHRHPTVVASYTEQRVPHYQGNPLIEALPERMTDAKLIEALTLMPEFAADQRLWPVEDRLSMLGTLSNFTVPMRKHIELCHALDNMLRSGYVGRAPRTPSSAKLMQIVYDKQKAGETFSQSSTARSPQLSTSLIGVSGMGKTTTVERWCAHIPSVIYHPEYNLYQVPYLHIEMPSDGSSIKGLAHAILHKLDQLIPNAEYFKEYAERGKAGADTLMRSIARLMLMHGVGLLICDEVQNIANAKKGGQVLMTELVSACNELKVAILFIGTNKAQKVLSADFRQARRASGALEPWDRLHQGTAAAPGEWEDFLQVLWKFQWTKHPVELDWMLAEQMYRCSQGVIDLAIKLFASAQARAMLDGSERLSGELIADVFEKEFRLMHPMVKALASNNLERLMEFDDICPLNLQQHLESAKSRMAAKSSPLFSVKSGSETFAPRLASGLTAMGFDAAQSEAVAKVIEEQNPGAPLAEGAQAAVKALLTPKPVRGAKSAKVIPLNANRYDDRPGDYRRAVAYAGEKGTKVFAELTELGMAPDLETILDL